MPSAENREIDGETKTFYPISIYPISRTETKKNQKQGKETKTGLNEKRGED